VPHRVNLDQLRCAGGCAGCCRALFDITLLDALLLQDGLARLPQGSRTAVLRRARRRLKRLQKRWPDFAHPYLLNDRPEEQWEIPEEDASPCILLDRGGKCLLYDSRPLTCRLHGLQQVDLSGEIFEETGCTLNAVIAPLQRPELRWEFRRLFGEEAALLRRFARALGRDTGELDTFIPTALLIDFDRLGDGP
jgi:Fe-S-cluster containining protein